MSDRITLTRPDDWHLHLRDGEFLPYTVPHTARDFGRAIVMPNLIPPVTTVDEAEAYRSRIMESVPAGSSFDPLMTLYLTDNTQADEIFHALNSSVKAVKLYPAGATTNSAGGVTSIDKIYPVIEALCETGLPLLIHGEVTRQDIDIFDREQQFIKAILEPLASQFPKLKIVLEHITTKDAARFVSEASDNVAATITPQHLLFNRNHMLVGGIKPHYYCLPVLKRSSHQNALLAVATSGNPKFFLGTDSAPHATHSKENSCGCAGCFTACAALELYAKIFDEAGALDKLEGFASHFGPDFYGLPRNPDTVTLVRKPWTIPESYHFGDTATITPLCHGQTLEWAVQE